MINKYFIIFMFISMVMGVSYYIATSNIIVASSILLLFMVLSLFVFIPKLNKFNAMSTRFNECYHFINNFIISLSIKKVVGAAFENTVLTMGDDFINLMNKLENSTSREKLEYLSSNYFPFYIYRLFIQIVDLYEEEGGDILEMSKYLLQEARHNEEYLLSITSTSKHKYLEISLLWGITLFILVLLRFTLTDFFVSIKNQLFYIVGIAAIFLFIALSIFVLISRSTETRLKGYKEHEKVI